MSKKKEEINQNEENLKEENLNDESADEKKKKGGGLIKKISGIFSGGGKKDSEDEDGSPGKGRDDEEEEKKPRKPFPVKEVLIVIGLSAALSVALLFLMNLGGLRTTLRSNMTDFLLGIEKEILTQKLEAEYQLRLDEELSQMLVTERENLVLEYENLDLAKKDHEKREKEIVRKETQVQTTIDELEAKKQTLLDQQAVLEGKISEIKDLAKIYENMEPKNAAEIMATMENETLMLGILGNMKQDAVAEILELMETQKAADIISKMGE